MYEAIPCIGCEEYLGMFLEIGIEVGGNGWIYGLGDGIKLVGVVRV